MEITNIHNAKTHLSKYLQKVMSGEEIIICSSNKPIAKLVPYEDNPQPRKSGLLKGKIQIKDGFDDLPKEFLEYF